MSEANFHEIGCIQLFTKTINYITSVKIKTLQNF